MALVAIAAALAEARAPAGQLRASATVCMYAGGGFEVADRAQIVASSIYAHVGIKLAWVRVRSCPASALEIRLTSERPPIFMPGTWAYAQPYEGTHVEVFLNRIELAIDSRRPILLGHVLAHEIGHILQGICRHSDTGLMKARWDSSDFIAGLEAARVHG